MKALSIISLTIVALLVVVTTTSAKPVNGTKKVIEADLGVLAELHVGRLKGLPNRNTPVEFSDPVICDDTLTVNGATSFEGQVNFDGVLITGGSSDMLYFDDPATFMAGDPSFTVSSLQSSVGAAGSADALPANPSAYWHLVINNVDKLIPVYDLPANWPRKAPVKIPGKAPAKVPSKA